MTKDDSKVKRLHVSEAMTPAHFEAFGRITHEYACVEVEIKLILIAVLEINIVDGFILLEPYGANDLKNVSKSLIKRVDNVEFVDRFVWLVGEWSKQNRLRNAIAHHKWVGGSREGSIKPIHLHIRSGKAVLLGDGESEPEWTSKELLNEALDLQKVRNQLRKLSDEWRLSDFNRSEKS